MKYTNVRKFSEDGNPWADEAMNSPETDNARFSQQVSISMVQDHESNVYCYDMLIMCTPLFHLPFTSIYALPYVKHAHCAS